MTARDAPGVCGGTDTLPIPGVLRLKPDVPESRKTWKQQNQVPDEITTTKQCEEEKMKSTKTRWLAVSEQEWLKRTANRGMRKVGKTGGNVQMDLFAGTPFAERKEPTVKKHGRKTR